MRHVLILRQQEEGTSLADQIREKGDAPYCFPLFHIEFFKPPPPLSAQGLIITSKNALRAFQHYNFTTPLPLYCVGDKTAEFAKNLGLSNVLSASGNKQDLIELICKHALPSAGPLIYCSGEIIKDGLAESLANHGFTVKRSILYKLLPRENLPADLLDLLSAGTLSHVLFFSASTTALFIDLLKKASFQNTTSTMTSLCLSPDVVKEAKAVAWEEIWTSPYPTVAAMMDYFQ